MSERASHPTPSTVRGLTDFILEKVHSGQYPPGFCIPSLRELMERFQLPAGAVRGAVDQLCRQGVLEKRHGSGTYVREASRRTEEPLGRRVAVFLGGQNLVTGIFSTVLLGMQSAAAELGASLVLHFNYEKMKLAELDELLAGAEGAVLLGAEEHGELYKKLAPTRPLVGVCVHDSDGGRLTIIDMDPFEAASLAVAHFQAHRVKEVTVVGHAAPTFENRARLFLDAWARHGGQGTLVGHDEPPPAKPKGGILFTSGGAMQVWAMRYRETHGHALASKASLLGFDGKNRIDPGFEPGPVVSVDWQAAGRFAVEECVERIENPGILPRRIYLPGRLLG
ncbi:MAG: GntR family transcriptional regulator [Spirochaetes bacterium]|nr:GntR family transcriptional regulator [Spirochaetota bacterium]